MPPNNQIGLRTPVLADIFHKVNKLLSIIKEASMKRDRDLLGRVFDDLPAAEISIVRLLK
jgi:hypothetical protein